MRNSYENLGNLLYMKRTVCIKHVRNKCCDSSALANTMQYKKKLRWYFITASTFIILLEAFSKGQPITCYFMPLY